MKRVLVIEDDAIIADGLRRALEGEGYAVTVCRDGDEGLHAARHERPDLLLLDLMIPNLNGFEITTELRRSGSRMPIIVVSARSDTQAKVRGLDLGADDYVTKPFDIEELLARIRRRIDEVQLPVAKFGGYSYVRATQDLRDGRGGAVELSPKEHLLLQFFLERPRFIVSREQIISAVWGDEYDGTDRTVDNFVMLLRRKIGAELIMTVRGQGYKFTP